MLLDFTVPLISSYYVGYNQSTSRFNWCFLQTKKTYVVFVFAIDVMKFFFFIETRCMLEQITFQTLNKDLIVCWILFTGFIATTNAIQFIVSRYIRFLDGFVCKRKIENFISFQAIDSVDVYAP